METRNAKRQCLARDLQSKDEGLEDEEEQESGEEDVPPAVLPPPLQPRWMRRRQLVRAAMSPSSGMFEDLYGVLDGYLGKMDVSDLRWVRSIGSRGTGEGQFQYIIDISVDAEHIVVSDYEAHNVSLFDKVSCAFIRKFGRYGSDQGQFDCPLGVCLDCDNVYVCDRGNNRVQVLTKEGVFVRFIGDATGDGKLTRPTDVTVDEQHVFVTSDRVIKVFTKQDGTFVREVSRLETATMSRAHFQYMAVSDGLLYATDYANQCISVFEG